MHPKPLESRDLRFVGRSVGWLGGFVGLVDLLIGGLVDWWSGSLQLGGVEVCRSNLLRVLSSPWEPEAGRGHPAGHISSLYPCSSILFTLPPWPNMLVLIQSFRAFRRAESGAKAL